MTLPFFSEMYHAARWHSSFPAPMVTLMDKNKLFVNDFLAFNHPHLGVVTGKLLKCFIQVCITDSFSIKILFCMQEGEISVSLQVDMLLTFEQLWKVHPEISILNVDSVTLIRCGQCKVIENDVIGVVHHPLTILELNGRSLTPLQSQVKFNILYVFTSVSVTYFYRTMLITFKSIP